MGRLGLGHLFGTPKPRPATSGQDCLALNEIESVGGEEEDRTPDLRIANATLSQLSYPPDVQTILAQAFSVLPSLQPLAPRRKTITWKAHPQAPNPPPDKY